MRFSAQLRLKTSTTPSRPALSDHSLPMMAPPGQTRYIHETDYIRPLVKQKIFYFVIHALFLSYTDPLRHKNYAYRYNATNSCAIEK